MSLSLYTYTYIIHIYANMLYYTIYVNLAPALRQLIFTKAGNSNRITCAHRDGCMAQHGTARHGTARHGTVLLLGNGCIGDPQCFSQVK